MIIWSDSITYLSTLFSNYYTGETVSVRTDPDVPGIPTNVNTTGNTATAVSLRFDSPIDYGAPIDYYEVAYRYYEPPGMCYLFLFIWLLVPDIE